MSIYERLRPMIIWLGIVELAWISYWLLSGSQSSALYIGIVIFWIISMLAWLGSASFMGMRGAYLRHTAYFSNLIGFASVIVFFTLIFCFIPIVWETFIIAAQDIPDVQLIAIHVLRLLAIGTIIKYLHGELPLHFLVLGSFPDFFFAISAVVVTTLTINGHLLGHNFLVAWHLLGSVVFLGAGFSMFFSVPSLLRFSYHKPDASIVFRFPMLLAPNFTVPLFVIAHLIALVKLMTN